MSSTIEIIDDPDMLENFKSTLNTNDLLKICKYEISDEFLEEVLEDSQYAIVHYANKNTLNLRGFALLTELSDEYGPFLYIDLICNIQNLPMVLRSQKGPVTSGKDIINAIVELALSKNIYRIKLSAIENVITYYYKLGFKLDYNPDREGKRLDILNMLKNKDSRIHDLGYEKLAIYQPGSLSEKNLAKQKAEQITQIKDKGIPMTIYLNNNQMQNAGRNSKKVRKIKHRYRITKKNGKSKRTKKTKRKFNKSK